MKHEDFISKFLEKEDQICDLSDDILDLMVGKPIIEIMTSVSIAISSIITDGAPNKKVAMQSVDILSSTIKELIRQSDEDGTAHWTLKVQ